MISNIELSAMSSHENIKVTTLDAAGTVNIDITNSSSRLSAVRRDSYEGRHCDEQGSERVERKAYSVQR
jgi:hypothetical protein